MKQFKYLIFLVLAIPALALAHGLVTTQSQTVNGYTIEFEYNTLGTILAGDYTLYDVYLLNPTTRDGIDYDSAFIRIEKKNGPAVLAGDVAAAPDIKGYASISGVINDPGIYTAEVSFYKNDKVLAESKFDYSVEKATLPQVKAAIDPRILWDLLILVLIVGAGCFWFIKSGKRSK